MKDKRSAEKWEDDLHDQPKGDKMGHAHSVNARCNDARASSINSDSNTNY